MGLDIKIPIGLMFVIFGSILGIYGMTTIGDIMYEKSLNININLWSGAGMFLFGGMMLFFSEILKKKNAKK
jgi:hypothetical protein